MRHIPQQNTEEAEIIALKALGFLAGEPERLQRFIDLSGLTLEAIRAAAAEPGFLGAILDHMLADQTLLLIFAEEHGLKPERIAMLRRKLPGAALDF
jgi:hypothetical protein